jgi:undecaprenyl-diphosphatase
MTDDKPQTNEELHSLLKMVNKYKKMFFILLSVFFLICFFLFSVLVKKHFLTQFDFNMSVYVQDDTPVKLDKVFQFFSSLASVEGMGVLLIIILIIRRQLVRGIAILSIFLASHIVELFGKVFINHPPPPFMFYKHLDASSFNFNKYYVQTGNSYPSGHSFRTVFVAIIFIYTVLQTKKLTPLMKFILILGALALICIVGISRVSLGEHWTSDVIGGGLFGLASGIFSLILL